MNNRINVSKLFAMFLTNASFRLSLSLFFGSIINFLYIAGNLASAFLYRNVWSATLTVYHSIFLAVRFYLIYAKRKYFSDNDIRRVCLRVGIFLLFLDLAATAMMVYTIRSGNPAKYSGVSLVGFIIYTLYSFAASVFGMKKYANDNQPLHFAARNMTLVAALMSVFNLQYSVLVSLGASFDLVNRIIALGGFSIFFAIILLSVRLVVKNVGRCSKI